MSLTFRDWLLDAYATQPVAFAALDYWAAEAYWAGAQDEPDWRLWPEASISPTLDTPFTHAALCGLKRLGLIDDIDPPYPWPATK